MSTLELARVGTALPVGSLVGGRTVTNHSFRIDYPVSIRGVGHDKLGGVTDYGFLVIFESAEDAQTIDAMLAPRTTYGRVIDTDPRDLAGSLRRIQARTGLDWGQIARTLGVSRRTLYNWLGGARVSGGNAARIAVLYRAVTQELKGVSQSDDARSYLLTPGADGLTPLARITLAIRDEHPNAYLPLRPVELLRPASSPFGRRMEEPPAEGVASTDI